MLPRWRYSFSFVGGLLIPLSLSPYDFYLIIFPSIAFFLYALRSADKRTAFFVGWFYGVGAFGLGVWWIQVSIHQFGIPYWLFSGGLTLLFIALMALYFAVLGLLLSFCNSSSVSYLFHVPILWLLSEYIRSNLFSGFPWLLVGYSQVDGPLKGWMPVVGSLGCSGIVVFVVAMCFWLSNYTRKKFISAVVILFGVFLSASILEKIEWTSSDGADLQVALVQGAIKQDIKWQSSERFRSIERYLKLTNENWDSDVIIWPETAIPTLSENIPELVSFLKKYGKKNSTDVLIGIPTRNPIDGKYYNSLLQLGSSLDRYSKIKLVPYGEYFPGKDYFGFLNDFLLIPMADLSPGAPSKNSFTIRGREVGILICYEIAFKDRAFSSLPESSYLANVSNDAWFGDTSAPFQHLQIARVRALESGRPIARSTNTGFTAFIDHKGRVEKKGPQFVPAVLVGTITGRVGSTPYIKYGDMPALIISITIILWFSNNFIRRLIYSED